MRVDSRLARERGQKPPRPEEAPVRGGGQLHGSDSSFASKWRQRRQAAPWARNFARFCGILPAGRKHRRQDANPPALLFERLARRLDVHRHPVPSWRTTSSNRVSRTRFSDSSRTTTRTGASFITACATPRTRHPRGRDSVHGHPWAEVRLSLREAERQQAARPPAGPGRIGA